MSPRLPVPLKATLVVLSAATDLVLVEKRGAWLIRGREAWKLSQGEWERLRGTLELETAEREQSE